MRNSDAVLDLGCAPGSWLQVAARLTTAPIVGVDRSPVRVSLPRNVRTIQADIFDTDPSDIARTLADPPPRPFDVILSDLGPATDGHSDHYVSVRLCDQVLSLATHLLKPTGHLAMKMLEGADSKRLLDDTASLFTTARGFKPKASRAVSREMYIVAKGLLP